MGRKPIKKDNAYKFRANEKTFEYLVQMKFLTRGGSATGLGIGTYVNKLIINDFEKNHMKLKPKAALEREKRELNDLTSKRNKLDQQMLEKVSKIKELNEVIENSEEKSWSLGKTL